MEGHAELIALQRLDETCAQLQKQVILAFCILPLELVLIFFREII
jgi:hypothetical protein